MDQTQHHQMELVQRHDSGTEEWHCPECGRRFLLQWPPNYKKVVIDAGDEYAVHSGGDSRLQVTDAHVLQETVDLPPAKAPVDDRPLPPLDPPEFGETVVTDELRPWLRFMNAAGLSGEDLGDK